MKRQTNPSVGASICLCCRVCEYVWAFFCALLLERGERDNCPNERKWATQEREREEKKYIPLMVVRHPENYSTMLHIQPTQLYDVHPWRELLVSDIMIERKRREKPSYFRSYLPGAIKNISFTECWQLLHLIYQSEKITVCITYMSSLTPLALFPDPSLYSLQSKQQ